MSVAEKLKTVLEDPASGLRERLVRSVGCFTTALFRISGKGSTETLKFGGTGSLVKFKKSHYILTAAHVWEDFLKTSDQVGITLKEDVDHRCALDTKRLIPFGPKRPEEWNQWGPDLLFLRIPADRVGGIEAFRSFYALDRERPNVQTDGIEVVILMGTPAEFGKFTEQHAELDIAGLFTRPPKPPYKHGDFDFIDLDEDVTLPGVPSDFAGVSGGGLWRVRVFEDPKTGDVDWLNFLEGLAFYQLRKSESQIVIRCHGDFSIRSEIEKILTV